MFLFAGITKRRISMILNEREMFSIGLAAQKLDWLSDCRTVFAIPISISSKNPFFDRK